MSEHVANSPRPSPAERPASIQSDWRWVWTAVIFLFILGLATRLSPLSDQQGRLLWQFMTEDGYLMQTIARNMALGMGMSTAEGTIATNGVQPMATFLFAGLHWLANGEKIQAIAWVTWVSAAIALVTAVLMAKVGEVLLAKRAGGRELAWGVAGLWFAAPLITRHSMNGLETGLYQAFILLSVLYYLRTFNEKTAKGYSAAVILGVCLGLTFLARNDAAFFIAAMLLVHLLTPSGHPQDAIGRRFRDALLAGSVSILVASPWLVHNYMGFGSIVPISGTAQSHWVEVGRNLPWLMATLFENMWIWTPLPSRFETMLPVQIACALVLLGTPWLYWNMSDRGSLAVRRHFLTGVLFTLSFAGYYGLYFGAHWFLPRYFSALSPFLWFFAAAAAYSALERLWPGSRRVTQIAVTCLCLLGVAFSVNSYRKGTDHMHKQVVDWTLENVDAKEWVAAPQTGTLGYFHDRTINLDGKVNPVALQRLIADGHSLPYVMDLPVTYLVDWAGLAGWTTDTRSPQFGKAFEVLVHDQKRNLAVLRRRSDTD